MNKASVYSINCQVIAEKFNSQKFDGETKEEKSDSQESPGFGSTRSRENQEEKQRLFYAVMEIDEFAEKYM